MCSSFFEVWYSTWYGGTKVCGVCGGVETACSLCTSTERYSYEQEF